MTTWMRRAGLSALVVFSLPILFHLYQPSIDLGGLGLFLGAIGYLVSPLILFGVLFFWMRAKW